MFPTLPPWTGLHPLIVHFPIALLLVAPILVVLSLVWLRPRAELAATALILMLLGTGAAAVAVSTGQAAGELADRTPEINAVLERHEELAEQTRNIFAGLTILFAALTALVIRRPALARARYATLTVVFLLLYGGGVLSLINAAHQGGQLVHRYGVHAMLPAEPPPEASEGNSH